MAEPSEEHFKLISKIFCSEYNRIHLSNFEFKEVESKKAKTKEVKHEKGDDFLISDGKSNIGIQHKYAEDTPILFKTLKEMYSFVELVEQKIKKDIEHALIYAKLNTVPASQDLKEKLANYIYRYVKEQLGNGMLNDRFGTDDTEYSEFIFKYLEDLDVEKCKEKGPIICWGHANFERCEELEGIIKRDLYRITQIDKHYLPIKTILLLESFPQYPDEIEINKFIEHFGDKRCNCSEIWIITTGNGGRCERIYKRSVAIKETNKSC
jgi:hypothetical protein